MKKMSKEIFPVIFLFIIIIGTPICGAQECEVSANEIICKNIVHQFPSKYGKFFYYYDKLQCQECQIQTFDKDSFSHETNIIRVFNLSHSSLQSIGQYGFSKLWCLNYLYLQNNCLKNVSENAFNGLTKLAELHLEDNSIETLNPGFLNGVGSKFINISNNNVEILPAEVFKGSVSLHSLDLSHNKISKIDKDSFVGLRNLEELNLNSNLICYLPLRVFRSFKTLKSLNLADNKLKLFNSATFFGLTNLEKLNLARNSLASFDSTVLLPIMHLTKLDISGNGINSFDAHEILLNVPTIKSILFEDNIFLCIFLKHDLQFFKSKSIDVIINMDRSEYHNVAGIACVNNLDDFDEGTISLKYFLEKSLEEASSPISYC